MDPIRARARALQIRLKRLVRQQFLDYVLLGDSSCRAVASWTGLTPSSVSQIMSGTKGVGLTTVCRLCVSTPRFLRAVIDMLMDLDQEAVA